MKIMERYLAALNRQDADAVASLFAEDCQLADYIPSLLGEKNVLLHGRNSVRDFFADLFARHQASASLVAYMNNRIIYTVIMDGKPINCVARFKEQQNLIQDMAIEPR